MTFAGILFRRMSPPRHVPPDRRTLPAMRATMGTLLAATLLLTGCGGPSEADQDMADTYCGTFRGLDEYENPDGYDRCVDENIENATSFNQCRDDSGYDDEPFTGPTRDRIYDRCWDDAGWGN